MPEQKFAANPLGRMARSLSDPASRSVTPTAAAAASAVAAIALLGGLASNNRMLASALLLGVVVPAAALATTRARLVGAMALAGAWFAAVLTMDVLRDHVAPRP